MELYVILYILLLFCVRFGKNSEFLVFLLFIIFSLLIGFRGETVGTDTVANMSLYESIGAQGYSGFPEPLYGLACSYAYTMGLSFPVFQSLLSFSIFCFVSKAICKSSPQYNLSVFLLFTMYFIFYAMNIYREMLACFFFLFVFVKLSSVDRSRRNYFISLILLLVCIGFHKSAIFLIPVIFIDKFSLNSRVIFLGFFLSFAIGMIDIVGWMTSAVGLYSVLMGQDEYLRSGGRLVMASFLLVYWLIGFFYLYYKSDKEMKNSIYLKMFFFGIIVYNLFIKNDMGLRIMLYFTIPLIIGIPLFIDRLTKKKLFHTNLVILYISIFFFVFLLANSADVVPYVIN